ncbi:MAG: hypothetical protein KDB80_02475 [Planctomycetes bacterium]|nr:hypothetical protein [Planctomycetota bacterium]
MKTSRRTTALRKLLALCDDLQRLRTRINDPELRRDTRSRLKRQARTKTQKLAADLAAYRFRGPLGDAIREAKLDSTHFLLLAILLQRHLRADSPALEGRALLANVFEGSFDVLAGIDLLHENGVLRASGLIELEEDDEFTDDVLDARFRISEEALIAFQDEVSGLVVEDQSRAADRSYESNRDFLIDLRILHNLCKHRADRVFQIDRWDRIRLGDSDPGRQLTRRIERHWQRMQRRLHENAESANFPAVRFCREHNLEREEIVIVVHLLFKELYEGNAYADAAELIRIVSPNERELLRNRSLMLETGRLRRHEILAIESMIEGRELTGEVHLADWVVNYLFGASPNDERIRADERLDWHLYLKKIEDTKSFYRDLEAN